MLSVDKTIAVDPVATVDPVALEKSISSATEALLGYRQSDGHFVFELEADSTIPSEYILLRHYLAEPVDSALEAKIANYLRRTQGNHGGWPLVQDGPFDMSASVKSYFALKMIGDSVDAPHMVRAREAIRSRGGAARVNVFTRFLLAFYGVLTWRAVPVLPIEIMLLPMWSPFHINKISYWARTTIVPLMVMAALKPLAKNPKGVGIDELFLQDPKSVGMTPKAPHQSWGWFTLFSTLDKILRVIEPLFPKKLRQRAIDAALAFTEERLNGEDGMGAIYPPMANIVMMYEALGKGPDFPPRAVTRRGIDKLLVIGEHEAYCQPCVSPVWDTALTCHALAEAGGEETLEKMKQGLDWLKPRQVLDLKGDWAVKAPDVRPGGWAFQYNNDYYPDLDDTAVVVMAMDRARRASGSKEYDQAISRGREWIEGLQSRDGGWAAFDVNNLEYYLNNIPFSDHGALLDPPTEDVTARCISMLAQLGETAETSKAVADGIAYLRRTQLAEGSWYGRWGLNLHLRHLVGAVCAQRRWRRSPGPDDAQGCGLAGLDPEQGWRLGRGCRQLSAGLQGIRGRSVDLLANGMGLAWTDGGRRGRKSGRRAGCGVPKSHTDRQRALGRGALHGYGLSAGVLFALSWLLEVLSALGAGAVPKFEKHQQQGGRGRDVTLGAGAAAIVDSSVDRNSNDPRPVLIVTGLVQEARIAAGPGMIVICSSSDPQQLRALLATLDSTTFRGVISFGVAGGLDPSLKSGDVVVATEVLSGDTRFLAGLALNEEMIARAALRRRRVVRGGLAGVEQVIAATACKAALHSETGAAAVDMESHIAAAYAAKAGLPFAALRVISDPASRALPALAKSAIKPNGDIDLRKVLRGVARNPTSLRALVSTGIDFNRALRSLRGCRGFLHGEEGLATAAI